MHIFPYSRRREPRRRYAGTGPESRKAERARRASEAAREMARSYAASFLGSVLSVLFEREEGGVWYGHAGNYLEAAAGGTDLKNKTLPVRIACVKERLLFGEIVWP